MIHQGGDVLIISGGDVMTIPRFIRTNIFDIIG